MFLLVPPMNNTQSLQKPLDRFDQTGLAHACPHVKPNLLLLLSRTFHYICTTVPGMFD